MDGKYLMPDNEGIYDMNRGKVFPLVFQWWATYFQHSSIVSFGIGSVGVEAGGWKIK